MNSPSWHVVLFNSFPEITAAVEKLPLNAKKKKKQKLMNLM